MNLNTFVMYIQQIRDTPKSSEKKAIIRDIISDHSKENWRGAIAIIAGEEFDNVGVAPKTIKNAIDESQLAYTESDIDAVHEEEGYVTEGLFSLFPVDTYEQTGVHTQNTTISTFSDESQISGDNHWKTVSELYTDCQQLHSLSGNELQSTVATLFESYYPPVVSFAILSDLNLKCKTKTIINAVAEDSYTKDQIQRARSFVSGPIEFIEQMKSESGLQYTIEPGVPFEPMLARNKSIPDNTDDWIAQPKLDGSRILIHVQESDVKGYTRNPKDVTFSLPELEEIDWPDGEYVFDCEAVAYDTERGTLPFSKTSSRIGRKHNLDQFEYELRFYLFDLLVDESEDITTEPLLDRLDRLCSAAPATSKYIQVVETSQDVEQMIQTAEETGYEGVIAKKKQSAYELGKRSSDWRKEKVTTESVDLRMISFEKQQGADTNTLGSIGLETSDGTYVGSVGTGWDDALAKKIWMNQDQYYGRIAEIRFEGFDENLRFPSFMYVRDDTEADSIDKVKELATEV